MTTLNQVYQNQLQKEVTINENFVATAIAGIFANRGNHNGLSFNYYGGRYQKQDGTQGSIVDGSITLNDNATNYVYFNLQDEIMESSTIEVPLNYFPIAKVITASGVISSIEDLRVVALYANGTPTNLQPNLKTINGESLLGVGDIIITGGLSYAEVIVDTTTSRNIDLTDAGKYLRFNNTAAKTVTFDSTQSFTKDMEFNIVNRGATGDLTLVGTGVTLNSPKNGTLILEPKDIVTVKFISSTEADVIGTTKAA